MENPTELKYTKDHEWVKVEGDVATIGITDHAQKAMTDIVFFEAPEKGKVIEQFKELATIESVKSVQPVNSPVSGEVVEGNVALGDAPDKINTDPYGEGWMVKIKLANPLEVDNLLSAEEYEAFLKEEAASEAN